MRTTDISDLLANLRGIPLDNVPVSDFGRCEPRKERAKQARLLFKQFGIKGVSVTTPTYSMARAVYVRIPSAPDQKHDKTRWPHDHSKCCGANGHGSHTEESRCPACRERAEIKVRIEAILWKAFPQLRDKSDSLTDYFNYCWSID